VPVVRPRFVVLDPAGSLRRLVARYLPGIEVAAVTDEEEAVRELARVPSQALLVNDSSVAQALQRLSASSALPRGTPAIICSVPGVPEAADALGVSDYLVKPVSRADLFGALERLGIHGGTVLVVDDEPEALRLFWRMLASAGDDYTVLTASNGEEALRVLRRKRPDVILLDLVMPGMDGFRLLELWGEDPGLRGIPVVVISARDPAGQPIVSNAVSVTQGGGLACHQVLACIDAIWRVLAPGGEPAGPVPPQSPRG
jgi:CheY-like chemotaxis protein